ncbi:MAG: hypothetical protein KME57_33430 [Scytonema hyalinum WJT4-NPBG1]|nr:hypothetical protein [Scytonema hyalinum WJT4-NPBG1]
MVSRLYCVFARLCAAIKHSATLSIYLTPYSRFSRVDAHERDAPLWAYANTQRADSLWAISGRLDAMRIAQSAPGGGDRSQQSHENFGRGLRSPKHSSDAWKACDECFNFSKLGVSNIRIS